MASVVMWCTLAIFLFAFRYVRLIVNFVSHWTYRSIAPPHNPTYSPDDVTIIVPSVDGDGDELRRTVRSCLDARPHELILVTIDASLDRAYELAAAMDSKRIRVRSVAHPNKRHQLCAVIPSVTTKIIILADDDVVWPTTLVPWILAPFENPKVGGVGTSQRLVRPDKLTLWTFLGALYLERRNFDCSACVRMDGGLPCLSGRTVAYRAALLQDPAFLHGFANETWRGNALNADDDNFITRWTYGHGWDIVMQYHKACEVRTTLEDGPKYLAQCLRWVRSNWRSNLTSLFVERHYWWTQPWTTYAALQTTLTAWAFTDIVIFWAIYNASEKLQPETRSALLVAAAAWIFVFAKTVKLVGHFVRYPTDIALLPVSILFGHFHGLIKLAGLLTMNATTWGSRAAADEHVPEGTISEKIIGHDAHRTDMPFVLVQPAGQLIDLDIPQTVVVVGA